MWSNNYKLLNTLLVQIFTGINFRENTYLWNADFIGFYQNGRRFAKISTRKKRKNGHSWNSQKIIKVKVDSNEVHILYDKTVEEIFFRSQWCSKCFCYYQCHQTSEVALQELSECMSARACGLSKLEEKRNTFNRKFYANFLEKLNSLRIRRVIIKILVNVIFQRIT